MLRSTHVSLGRSDPDAVFIAVSPDNRHVAYVVERAGEFFVVLDGAKHKEYDWIGQETPLFSPDSQRMAYVAMVHGQDTGPYPVLDGVEQKRYFASGMYLCFSPDGRRLAYAAAHGPEKGQFVVVDEIAGKEYDGIGTDSLRFSPDSQRIAYGARRGDKWLMVIDGREQKAYDGLGPALVFSPDSRRWAYVAKSQIGSGRMRRPMVCVVVDGVEGEYYDGTIDGTPSFSPDSQRVAYGASLANAIFAVVDGKKGTGYKAIECLTFSPDSRHLAYVAFGPVSRFMGLRKYDAFRTVVNGVEGEPYIDIALSGIRFSPDSRRTAYVMQNFDGWSAVIDGVEQGPYESIGKGTPLFSPDSRRCACCARLLGSRKMVVVVDGAACPEYDFILGPTFSPDSRRLAYAGRRGDKWRIVVDREETDVVYDDFFAGSDFVWDGNEAFHTLAVRDGEIVGVQVEPDSPRL
jgi:WD40-like Beta Propeller Repeat